MILTDDNFGTLVHAVEIGRRVYEKIVAYVRYQMTQLLALVLLFVAATAFNINEGVALTPSMVLYLLFFATAVGRGRSSRSTRATPTSCTGRRGTRRCRSPTARPSCFWVLYAVGAVPRRPGAAGRRARTSRAPTRRAPRMTMTFVVMGLGTVVNALTNRRDPASGLTPPILKAAGDRPDPGRARRPGHPGRLPAAQPADPAAHRPAVAGLHRARAGAARRHRGQQVDPPPPRARAGRRSTPPRAVARRADRSPALADQTEDIDGEARASTSRRRHEDVRR